VLGTRLRKGRKKYAMGKKRRKMRQDLTVPSLALRLGYTRSWREMPRTPRTAMATPTSLGLRPSPPVKKKGGLRGKACLDSGGEDGL
jgi:hypothetical protein